jgi:hypothetical protein
MNRVADGDENSNVVYKGDVTISEDVIKPDVDGEIWLYRVMFSENDYHIGDYLIVSKQGVFHFGLNQVKHKMSSGVRFCEKKEWQLKNYEKDNSVQIKMLFSNKRTAVNILKDPTIVKNLKEVKLIDYTKMDDDVEGVYVLSDEGKTMETSKFLMMERDFGKIDAKVENLDNLILDRGYASAFEMHFKLSEVNTLEDMENFKSAVIRMVIKNPLVYIRTQLGAWSYISTANYYERKLDIISNFFTDLYVPTIWLLGLWVFLLVKKKWCFWFMTSCHLCHMGITTALLPASYFKYYYSEYLYAVLTIVLVLLLWRKKTHESKEI